MIAVHLHYSFTDLNLHQAYKMFVVWDYVALVLYFILVVGVGLWSMKGHDRSSLAGYFLAGKNMIWFMVGASLFSSNIGSEHFVGLAGSGAATGIAIGAYELNAMYLCQLLGWVFLPVYIAGFCYTMPEYLKKRFGGKRIQVYIAVLSLALYVLVKISVDIYSASLFIQVVIGWNLYASVAVILALTAIYAVTGGLAAVIYTDTLQTILIVVGALFLMIYSLIEIGGIKGLYYGYMSAVPNTTLLGITECGYPLNDSFKMLREPSDNILPWPGFFLGQTTASIWYWCADQVIVQRALSAKSLSHAQGGTLMAGYLKILPTFMFVIPGMISRVLYTDAVACVLPEACERICGNSVSCSNIAYPLLVTNLLPDGFRGLMLAVMLAALMSSLSSICNSASTVFTIDIWSTFRKQASEKEKMIIGRVLVFILLTVSILWIPVVQATQGGMLFIYIQTITGYLTPPITAVFLGGLLWKRINEQGAFWSLIVGIVIGGIRMVLDFVYPAPSNCEEDTRPPVVALNFMYFALMLFWICVFVMIVISLLTEPPPENRDPMLAGFRIPSISQDIAMGREILRLTFWTRHSQERYEEFPESNVRDKYDMDKGKGDGRQDNENKEDAKEEDKMESSVDGQIDGKGNENLVAENDTSSPTPSPSSENQESKLWQCWKWFCGFQSERTPSPEPHAEMVQRLSSIEQTRKEKVILNINLIFILCFSFFLFMFFTFLWVRPFTT
ncbi:sodium/myo-inositol cotransporter 2-like isoform X3 [Ptychodera flava]|uniref:sodium/myo-inositol cotransporter 2-like isoform X3 n=1 Tax=Ptychodera flava TaxID=63121 RepID=UPI00396A6180